jgi:hypothetical protein
VPRYDLLVDGERQVRVKGDDEVRTWLARYREEHVEDDPDATHVQVIEVHLMGGKLIPRDAFF